MRSPVQLSLLSAALVLASACSNYRDQLERADTHYRAARYEAALKNLEDLEPDRSYLGDDERVRYEYVRGMTHARLGQRAEARHWLSRAREDAEGNNALNETMRSQLQRTLNEIDWVSASGREEHAPPPDGTNPADTRETRDSRDSRDSREGRENRENR